MATITISRGTFSGGEKLSELISEKLGFECISREVLLEASRKYNASLKKARTIDDAPRILQELGIEKQHYLNYIRLALLNYIKKGNVVYHGHAGHLLLKGIPHILKIRVIAGRDYRIKSAMAENNLDRAQAESYINNIDFQRAEWTRFLYGKEIGDQSLYDMVINLEHATVESAFELICSTIESSEYKSTPESRKKMEDFILAAELVENVIAK